MLNQGAAYKSLASELADARRLRDSSHKSLALQLVGKELVQTAVMSGQFNQNDEVDLNDSSRRYLNLFKRVQEEKKIAKSSVDKKVTVFLNGDFLLIDVSFICPFSIIFLNPKSIYSLNSLGCSERKMTKGNTIVKTSSSSPNIPA